MIYKYIFLCFAFCSIIGTFQVKGQESINTSGGEASGSGGTISYSIGQIVFSSKDAETGSVTEGVQQPFEISTIIGIELSTISLNVSVYPNPTTDFLKLKVETEYEKMIYQLYDIKGEILQTQAIISKETKIEMSKLTPSIYFVRVIKDNKEIKTFKVIKNN